MRTKRVYAPPAGDDGLRILVDRLWPRGLAKADAAIDHWLKEVAPSAELRKWFGHRPERWPEFRRRYLDELARNPEALDQLRRLSVGQPVTTLLFAAHDEVHNNAAVLLELLTAGQKS